MFMRSRSLVLIFPGVMVITKSFIFFVCSPLIFQLLARYVFIKLLRPLAKQWKSMGLRVIVYIDDGICVSTSESARG